MIEIGLTPLDDFEIWLLAGKRFGHWDWYTPMLFLSAGLALAMMELYTKFKGAHHVC